MSKKSSNQTKHKEATAPEAKLKKITSIDNLQLKAHLFSKISRYFLPNISCQAIIQKRFKPVLSLVLIVCLLTINTPAFPQATINSITNWKQNIIIAANTGNWYEVIIQKFNKYFSQGNSPSQETQEERNSRVVRIEIQNSNQTLPLGLSIPLRAIPYDQHDIPVSGVRIDWEVEDIDEQEQVISNDMFKADKVGQFKLIATGAGKKDKAKINVVAPESILSDKENGKASAKPELLPYEDWNETNIHYTREPSNARGNSAGIPKENSNFNIVAPVLSMPGRAGLDLQLKMHYNSRAWTKMGQDISYNMDKEFPAPGWSLGLGKVINLVDGGIVQIDGDGTRRLFKGDVETTTDYKIFRGTSTDGTFIKALASTYGGVYQSGVCYWGGTVKLTYPDGRSIIYNQAFSGPCYPPGTPIIMVPTGVGDKFENHISFTNWGTHISNIKDTLGRYYQFHYTPTMVNGEYLLTHITAQGPTTYNGQPGLRTLVRFNYKNHQVTYNFSGLNAHAPANTINVLSSIYYPSTNTGYWFGDADSYSPYGMIRKVEEQRGMSFNASTGNIIEGQTTRSRVYSYPTSTATALNDVPSYDTVSETWEGMPDPSSPAVTTYQIDWNSSPRTTTIIQPYQSGKTVEYSHNLSGLLDTNPEKAKDGKTFKTEFYDGSNVLRTKDEVDWELGYNVGTEQNPVKILRPKEVRHTEYVNGVSLTKKTVYDSYGDYNRVQVMRELGYGGDNDVLRKTVTQYYDNPTFNLLYLPSVVEVFDNNNVRIDYTKYEYDLNPISNFSVLYPTNWGWGGNQQDPTQYRGNLSKVIKNTKAADLSGQVISDNRVYDKAGNLVFYESGDSSQQQNYFHLTLDIAYAFPSTIEQRKKDDTTSTNRLVSTATYDLNMGVPLSVTDVNQQTTTLEYDAQTWRLKKTISPTGAYTVNDFDDMNRVYTQTAYTSTGAIAGKQVSKVNGLSLPYRQETLSGTDENEEEIYDVVETKYDNLGRAEKTSNPFRSNESTNGAYWTQVFYDELGRIWKTKSADGSEKFTYFNEASRPNVASSSLGHTFRVKDPIGRQKWYRLDSDGNVAEVVEPKPDGDGSVSSDSLLTKYYYDKLGRLTRTEQGTQERKFRYDSLGRLTNQKMAETKATLNDNGLFVGESTGQWSDFYTYDEISNVVSSTDARGVKTVYSYVNPSSGQKDPLNRIFSITFETNGATGVLPSPTIKYEYKPSGNIAQIKSIYTENMVSGNPQRIVTYDFGYDSFGRINEKKTTLASRSSYPMTVNYSYDSLSRITDVFYPKQYGITTASGTDPRKQIHNDYDIAGRMSALKVDGADYASNFVFNNFDQITSVKIGPSGANQINETYNYNPQTGLLENQKVLKGGAALLDLSYQYQQCSCSTGGSGQITKIVNNLDRNKDRAYEYDALSRLKKVTGGVNRGWSQSYSYDRYGNRYNVSSLGFESLRSSEQENDVKNGQEKILNESMPSASLVTKDKLLEDVRSLTESSRNNNTPQSPVTLYRESEQISNNSVENDKNIISTEDKKINSKTKPAKTESLKTTNESSIAITPGTPFDFDGDGKADFSTWRRTSGSLAQGTWVINNSQTQQNSQSQLSSSGNQIAPGDYDGDGKTDKAVWNTTSGVWTIQYSSNGTTVTKQWGTKGDALVPADYDGDGKTDVAVWRASTGDWLITKSSDNTWYSINFGGQKWGDIPLVGDYDGDGRDDITVWRPAGGDWYLFVLQSSSSQVLYFHWGAVGDVPVAADFDGDNKTDLAVWRPTDGYWYISQSSNGQLLYASLGNGASKDVLVPADYDGDGKADMAVWTPSTGTWTVRKSTTGTNITHQLGTKDDIAVPSAYIRRSSAPRGQSVEIPNDGIENLSFDPASNRITTSNFQYDYAGNQTQIVQKNGDILQFQYDAAGRMIKVKDDNDQTIATYTYGIGRERLITQDGNESSTNLTYYAWGDGSVVSEYVESAGNVLLWTKNYIFMGGALLATQDRTANGERVQFDHPDHLGTRLITDPGAETHFEQTTLPFGTELESETTGSINRRFTSYDRSSSTGLDYATNRFYDSSQGRFTTVDPIKMSATSILNPQTMNLYSYTANDPINRTDPSGLDWGFSFGGFSIGLGGYPIPGASSNSIMTGLGQFLTGLLGNLFNSGGNYPIAFYVAMPFNPGAITPSAPTPLPGAGTIVDTPPLVKTDAYDCSSDGAVSKYSYVNSLIEVAWRTAMKAVNEKIGYIGFTEMFRTTEHQQAIFDKRKKEIDDWQNSTWDYYFGTKPLPAASPGTSSHEAGFSFDVPSRLLNGSRGAELIKILKDNGFVRDIMNHATYGDDPVHFTHTVWGMMGDQAKAGYIRQAQEYAKKLGLPATAGESNSEVAAQKAKETPCF